MAQSTSVTAQLKATAPRLLGRGATGGLIAGAVMAVWMMVYDVIDRKGLVTMLNQCFASFVFPNTMAPMAHAGSGMAGMSSMNHTSGGMADMGSLGHAQMGGAAMHHMSSTTMSSAIVPSHLMVGVLLHLGMAAAVGVSFAVALWALSRLGLSWFSSASGVMVGSVAGGALLYVIMMYAILPATNPMLVDTTPHGAFFAAHLLFGAVFALTVIRTLATSTAPAEGKRRVAWETA